MKEFTIENRSEAFRVSRISPVEMLAILPQIDFDNMGKTETLYTFCLEHVEVLQGDKWVPVKAKGRDVYFPIGIEEDYTSLNKLVHYIVNEVIWPAFTKCSK